jgi:hypothetical protein
MKTGSEISSIPIHFIVSTGRTGSTLLTTMLNAHPEILAISEQPFTLNLIDGYLKNKNWNESKIKKFIDDFFLFATEKLPTQFSKRSTLEKLFEENKKNLNFQLAIRLCFLAFFSNKKIENIKLFVSKELILHTQIKKITQIYPQSKFILLARDPRDNVQIKINRASRRGAKYNLLRFVSAWEFIYKYLSTDLRKYAKNKFITIRYEDLVTHTELTLNEICEFLNMEYHPDMLNYNQNNTDELKARRNNIPDKLFEYLNRDHQGLLVKPNTDKIGIWRTQMNKETAIKIWNECKDRAQEFGYFNNDEKSVVKQNFGIRYKMFKIWFYFSNILIPKIYYKTPFVLRKFFKKIKKRIPH